MTTLDPTAYGVVDDGRRWWPVVGDGLAGEWMTEARSARSAVASLKRDMFDVEVRSNGVSQREAREWIRLRSIACYAGPYSTSEAFVRDVGWALNQAVCRRAEGTQRLAAVAPIGVGDCAPWLDDAEVERIVQLVARQYRR